LRHSLAAKWIITIIPVLLILAYALLTEVAPSTESQDNLCVLFKEHPSWYWSAQSAQLAWGVPISVQMAIIHRESHFRADAKPPHKKVLGFIPWLRPTTAEGYAQAVDGTWQDYLRGTSQRSARRASFANATDFIGWYVSKMHSRLGISKSDARSIYLAYYLGMGGYHAKRYQNNKWLLGVAAKVGDQQQKYHQQLIACKSQLPHKSWWHWW